MQITELNPREIWQNFYLLTQVPRPSGHLTQVQDFLLKWAAERGIEAYKDGGENIVMRKPATPGHESSKTAVLQAHMDMVPQKLDEVQHNFETDPIQTWIDGEWVKAKGTTLGADDGIGVAMQMAILADNSIQHGPLECLFTVCEEQGLNGAMGLEAGFMKADYLINLDSEDEGLIFVSCAGGANTKATFHASLQDTPDNQYFFTIKVSGLTGGHSGDDIEKKRANANKLIARLLNAFKKYDILLADIQTGGLHNAIPRDGKVTACIPMQHKENLRVDFNILTAEFEEEFTATEKNMQFHLETADPTPKVIDKTTGDKLITALVSVPNGVLAMDQNIPNFVETSSNLASVRLNGSDINIVTSQRSNIMSARKNASAMVSGVFALAGADVETGEGYPGWKLNPNSPLLTITINSYNRLFGKDPEVRAIHAGLECGLFSLKYPHVDMVSFGPTLRGVHSPEERLLIPTVQKVWDHLLEVLKNIPTK